MYKQAVAVVVLAVLDVVGTRQLEFVASVLRCSDNTGRHIVDTVVVGERRLDGQSGQLGTQ